MSLHITVVPASTQAGRETIRSLLNSSAKPSVRGVYRDESKAPSEFKSSTNFEAVQGDVSTDTGIDFSNTDVVFYVPPPIYDGSDIADFANKTANNVKKALEAAPRVKKLVIHSAVGAHNEHSIGLMKINTITDKVLRSTVSDTILVKPGYYYEMFFDALKTIRAEPPTVESFVSPEDHGFPMVSVKDVGAYCANALLQAPSPGLRSVDLFGPQLYSALDIKKAAEEITGKQAKLKLVKPEGLNDYFATHMPKNCADEMAEMIMALLPGGVLTQSFAYDESTVRGKISLIDSMREHDRQS